MSHPRLRRTQSNFNTGSGEMLRFALALGDRLRDRHVTRHPWGRQERASNEREQRAAPLGARPLERDRVWMALTGTGRVDLRV